MSSSPLFKKGDKVTIEPNLKIRPLMKILYKHTTGFALPDGIDGTSIDMAYGDGHTQILKDVIGTIMQDEKTGEPIQVQIDNVEVHVMPEDRNKIVHNIASYELDGTIVKLKRSGFIYYLESEKPIEAWKRPEEIHDYTKGGTEYILAGTPERALKVIEELGAKLVTSGGRYRKHKQIRKARTRKNTRKQKRQQGRRTVKV